VSVRGRIVIDAAYVRNWSYQADMESGNPRIREFYMNEKGEERGIWQKGKRSL